MKNSVITWPTVLSHEIRFRNFVESWRRSSFRDSPRSAWPANCKTSVENRDNASQGGREGRKRETSACFSMNALRRDCVPTGGSHY